MPNSCMVGDPVKIYTGACLMSDPLVIFATATRVLGNAQLAERWLNSPALALDGRRPVDVLSAEGGFEMVEQLLGRLEYGVYT